MTWFAGKLMCVLLVTSILSSMTVVGAGDDYALSFDDPQEYPDYPDADLKSLNSQLSGNYVVVELTTYGNISNDSAYSYSFSNVYIYNDPAYFGFYLCEGNGVLYYYSETESIELNDTWGIVNNTLVVSVPLVFAGPSDTFNISATASYFPESMVGYTTDYINMLETPYMDPTYNFTDAKPLWVPDSVSGSLDEGMGCIYSMELTADTGVLIVLNGSLGDWPNFSIFDSEQHYITSSSSAGKNSRMTFIPKTTGTYYVAIESGTISGSYRITTSLRGESGKGYERATPEKVPWQVGDKWSAGGYISTRDIIAELLGDSGSLVYAIMFPQLSTDGGLADFIVVTYAGMENSQYRFDYTCRIYCDITLNMTSVTRSESYMDDEQTSGSTSTMHTNTSGIVDVTYNGSAWLGYYENGEGDAYYGVEKEFVSLTGSLEVYMGMSDYTTYTGMEDIQFSSESQIEGTIDLEIMTENTPGIPYLPAGDKSLSVDKKALTSYKGSMDMDMWVFSNYSDMEEYPSIEPEDMNETMDTDFNGSYLGYYMLEYHADTNVANVVPLITDPFSFLMLATTNSYGSLDGVETTDPYPYWLDYGNSKATYNPKTGFYTSFELPLSPLSSGAMSLDETDGSSSTFDSLSMLGILTNLPMSDVSNNDAEAFFENPAGFISAREDGGASSAPFMLIIALIAGILIAIATSLLIVQRRMNKPEEPAIQTNDEKLKLP